MRKLNKIIVHCSATPRAMDIGVQEIKHWHVNDNGWNDIGYHFVIRRNGEIEIGRPLEIVGAHVAGHNEGSIGICLVGGSDANDKNKADFNYTHHQLHSLWALIHNLITEYDIPKFNVFGHRDFTKAKTCPNFDVASWWDNGNKPSLNV